MRIRRAGVSMSRSVILTAIAVLLVAVDVAARPGGGHSYSGGGHSSDSGGGGGGGSSGGGAGIIFFFVRLLLDLCIEAPIIGIPLVIALLVGVAVVMSRANSNRDWNGPSEAAVVASRTPSRARTPNLDAIRQRDPDFSSVLFEDFAYALFATAHRARSDAKKLAELAPYLDDGPRRSLAERATRSAPVTAAIVGALRIAAVELSDAMTQVTLEFEANLLFGGKGTEYVLERWVLRRGANVKSRDANAAKTFVCPNCGAPFESTDSQRCGYCHEVVANGRFDWSVSSIELLESSERPPSLTGSVAEQGTDLPTIIDPDFRSAWASLCADDPAITADSLGERAVLIHRDLNTAWSTQDLAPVRGFVSDGLFDYLGYWTAAYRTQGLRNIVEGAAVMSLSPVKVRRDRHCDAVTLRIFANGKDFTLDARGAVVGGNRHKDRVYSEYWTLIRAAGKRGAPKTTRACPNCGAELNVTMSGECTYCRARVTTGEFDWVLSKIEQDDSYAG